MRATSQRVCVLVAFTGLLVCILTRSGEEHCVWTRLNKHNPDSCLTYDSVVRINGLLLDGRDRLQLWAVKHSVCGSYEDHS